MTIQTDHPLVSLEETRSIEDLVLSLIHRRAYEEALHLASGRSVLDWGCNDGYGIEILSSVASKVAGLDTGLHCIQAARERLPQHSNRILHYDGVNAPFGDERFDLIVSFQVIEHVSDVHAYLGGITSALSPGALAVFTTPNRLVRLDPGMKPWNPFHVTEFSPRDLADVLKHHFSTVALKGLTGNDALIQVEMNRCQMARLNARHSQATSGERRFRPLLVKALRTQMRERVGGAVRKLVRRKSSVDGLPVYTTGDLFYSSAAVNNAIDLMAICHV